MTYFPLTEYWWFYLAFTAFVLLVLSLDLGGVSPQGAWCFLPRGFGLERSMGLDGADVQLRIFSVCSLEICP